MEYEIWEIAEVAANPCFIFLISFFMILELLPCDESCLDRQLVAGKA